jgi:hypothetical protein
MFQVKHNLENKHQVRLNGFLIFDERQFRKINYKEASYLSADIMGLTNIKGTFYIAFRRF